jgi:hypothetical protein
MATKKKGAKKKGAKKKGAKKRIARATAAARQADTPSPLTPAAGTSSKASTGDVPGFSEALHALSTSLDYLKTQGDLWKTAWTNVASGQFELKSWLATAAQSVDATWQFAHDLYQVPSGGASQTPPWVRLEWIGDNAPPSRSVQLNTALKNELIGVPFTHLGPGSSTGDLPELSVQKITASSVRVGLNAPSVRPADGKYISFVFEKGTTDAPIVIVLLDAAATAEVPGPLGVSRAQQKAQRSAAGKPKKPAGRGPRKRPGAKKAPAVASA